MLVIGDVLASILGQIKKIVSFSSGSVKKSRREGRFNFYFCNFFLFHSGWPLNGYRPHYGYYKGAETPYCFS